MINDEPAKYLRQMFHRPNMTAVVSILVILIGVKGIGTNSFYLSPYSGYQWAAMENDHYVSRYAPVVYIRSCGTVYFDGRPVEDFAEFSIKIGRHIGFYRGAENKIHLEVEETTPFGIVQRVLKAAQIGTAEEMTFITRPNATYADFWFPKMTKWQGSHR